MLLEPHEGEAGSRRVAALVASIDACPLPGLFAAIAGEDAEADGNGMLYGKLMQPCGRLPRDDVVMGSFATDNAAERDAAAMPPRSPDEAISKSETERECNFKRAGHGEALIRDILRFELCDRAACKLVGDVLVESRFDDED